MKTQTNVKEQILNRYDKKFVFTRVESSPDTKVIYRVNPDKSISLALPENIKAFLSQSLDRLEKSVREEIINQAIKDISEQGLAGVYGSTDNIVQYLENLKLTSQKKEAVNAMMKQTAEGLATAKRELEEEELHTVDCHLSLMSGNKCICKEENK